MKITQLFKKKSIRIFIISIFSVLIFFTVILFGSDFYIDIQTENLVYNYAADIPHNKVGLLLGTSKYWRHSGINQYFQNRIMAAYYLYYFGKIDFILISGDNSREDYNEPMDMKIELIKLGVPESKIFLDYAGFRTYDSIIRINKIFGQTNFTVISQEFHNRRAIYIANSMGYNAVGYNAKDVTAYLGFKTKLREKFARLNVFIDLITGKRPKFLGEEIEIK